MSRKIAGTLFVTAATFVIAAATLTPATAESSGGGSPWWCLTCGGAADTILNLALFIPLGLGLALMHVPFRRVALLAAATSGLIEAMQFAIIAGRDASLGDLLSNALGAILGVALVTAATRVNALDEPTRRQIGLSLLLAAGFAIPASMALTTASLPQRLYYGQWNHVFGSGHWDGARVLAASVGSQPLPDHEIRASPRVRELLAQGAPLEILAIAGGPESRVTSLFSISSEDNREVLLVGPDREDLVFRLRMRANDLRLDQPQLRLAGALRGVREGDTLRITISRPRPHYCMRLNDRRTCDLGYSAAAGWQLLLYPEHAPSWLRSLGGACWLALLTVPFAFATRRTRDLVLGTIALASAPALATLLPGVIAPTLVEWLGLPFGAVLGRLLGRRVARSRHRSGGVA